MTKVIYGSTNSPIICDIPDCVNPAAEIFDENIDETYSFTVCLCRKCKEKW